MEMVPSLPKDTVPLLSSFVNIFLLWFCIDLVRIILIIFQYTRQYIYKYFFNYPLSFNNNKNIYYLLKFCLLCELIVSCGQKPITLLKVINCSFTKATKQNYDLGVTLSDFPISHSTVFEYSFSIFWKRK